MKRGPVEAVVFTTIPGENLSEGKSVQWINQQLINRRLSKWIQVLFTYNE